MFTLSAACLSLFAFGPTAFGDTLTYDLPNKNNEPAKKSLAAEYEKLIPALIGALGEEDQQTWSNASETLVALGYESVPALLKAIRGDNAEIRSRAAWAIGKIASGQYVPHEAVPVLIQALKDEDQLVKQAATYAIKQLVVNSNPAPSPFPNERN